MLISSKPDIGGVASQLPRGSVNTMAAGSPAVLRVVALLIVAPIGAAVIVAALLLFGVDAHLVFLPGFFIKSKLEILGFHAANRVGVVITLVLWWAIIVSVWLALRKLLRRAT